MALVASTVTLTGDPELVATGTGSSQVYIVTDGDLLVGGTETTCTFPLTTNDTDGDFYSFPLGYGEELWADGTAEVQVLVFGT